MTILDTSPGRPGRSLLIAAGVVLLLVLLALWRSLGGNRPDPGAGTLPLVTVVVPGASEIVDSVTFTGTIAARDELPIGIEGEGGRIAAVLVEIGDRVRAGQVLARLDTAVLAPQVGSLEAALEEARANAELARADSRRADAVVSVGALSAQEIERRRSAAVSADAKVKVAAAQLAEARARLRRTEVRAPMAGIVLTRNAEVGQNANGAGEPLFRLGRGGEIEMRGRVPEQDLPRLAVGQAAQVRVTGIDSPFAGKVRLLGAVIDPQTRLGTIRVALDPHPNLRPGAFARGEVLIGRFRRPVVPQTAVLSDEAGTYVLIVGQGERVERRNVRVSGTRGDGLVIEQGLDGSERVVATAAAYLRVDERVALAPAASKGEAAGVAAAARKP
ncbi:MAG: efflux RND transporter periplasmic adaptor subunit [Steroidobacteraceae bacterium]